MSAHSFNSKSSHWNYKDSKHTTYSYIRTIKKSPTKLSSTNVIPHSLNKQFSLQKDRSVNNSVKIFPHLKNYKRLSLKNFNKQNNLSQKTQNAISKICDYKTSKCFQESAQTSKDSKKLIGEIVAITHQLKMKSESLGSSCVQRYQQEKYGNSSKIKCIKAPTKESAKNRNSLSQYSSCSNKKGLKLCTSSNDFQIQAACSADRFKKIINHRHNGNKTVYTNVQMKLNRIEKILENSSNRTAKNLPCNSTPKANVTNSVINKHSNETNIENSGRLTKTILRPKIESKKIIKQNSRYYAINDKNILKNCQTFVLNRKLNKSCSSFSKKANHLLKTPNELKSKYKIVNKALATKKILAEKSPAANCNKNLKLSCIRERNSYKLINVGKKTASNSKISHNHLSLKNSPRISVGPQHISHGRQKHVFNYVKKKQNVISSHMLEHVSRNKFIEIHNDSGVDKDLLVELAEENNKNLKQFSQRRLYKSKNRIINNYSIQKRTVKMIKLKYFNPSRKCTDWRNLPTKAFKGFFKGSIAGHNKQNRSFSNNNKRSIRSNKNASNKFQSRKVCLQNKKIITLKGEQFIIGSQGKSLRKLKQISKYKKKTKKTASYNKLLSDGIVSEKIASPASKIMANRVLNLSINRMLSASEKKKMNKVNTYCMFYNRFGRCNKGAECPYVHDPSKIAVCTRFLRGTCKNDKCPFSHEINPGKMAICSFFLQDICSNTQCPYRHEKLSSDAKLCKDFVQGYCLKGKECKKAHVLICPKYIQGICEKGKDCAFPHPAARDKKIISKECASAEKPDDYLSETVSRYFQSNHDGNIVRGLVVPRRKTLPEQPSFISLTLEKSS